MTGTIVHAFLGWPDGSVWGNLAASALTTTAGGLLIWWRARVHIGRHAQKHAEDVAFLHDHMKRQAASLVGVAESLVDLHAGVLRVHDSSEAHRAESAHYARPAAVPSPAPVKKAAAKPAAKAAAPVKAAPKPTTKKAAPKGAPTRKAAR